MEYYPQISAPQLDPNALSGGVSFQFNGAVAAGQNKSHSFNNVIPSRKPTIVTLQVCVDGVTKSLDVWANGQPY